MQVARIVVPRITKRRTSAPWLFVVFLVLVFAWMFQSNPAFALGALVSACAVVAALESAYAGMYVCTALFAGIAMVFNPSVHVLPALDFPVTALAIIALAPMLLLFACRKVGPYVSRLPDGSRWWLPAGRTVLALVE
jgi:hypothetical protein